MHKQQKVEVSEEIRKLKWEIKRRCEENGITGYAIARDLGVSHDCAYRALDPNVPSALPVLVGIGLLIGYRFQFTPKPVG